MTSEDAAADVLVVGGGVAGLCVAEGLANAGAQVVLVEAGAIGSGASGQSSGQLLLGVIEAPHRVVASLGEARTRELFSLTETSVAWLGDLVERRGLASLALDDREPDELDRTQRVLSAMGLEASLQPPERAVERFPISAPLLTMPMGGRVVPDVALAGLAERARAASVRVLEHHPLLALHDTRDGYLAQAGTTSVTAEVVVWAAGVATRHLEPALAEALTPVREQALAIEGLPPGSDDGGRAGYGYTWFERRGSVGWVGGCRWATPHLEVGETEPVPQPLVQARIEAFAERLGWLAEGRSVARRWAWIDAYTKDGLPLIGPVPGSNRLLACTGFCGNDWGLGPGAARLVVEGLMGECSEASPLFAPSRFL
ncbi:MAG: FAD-binding oxidoreductase [Myxococcota bacterium]